MENENKKRPVSWWKRFAYLGFWFFFFKGIAWIIGIVLFYFFGSDVFDVIKSYILAY